MLERKPKLIRTKDYFIILFPVLLSLIVITTAVLSHLNYDTWGEKVPTGGWITVGAMLSACVLIPVFYFIERHNWISKWKYTTKHGVQCFFEDGTTIYSITDVENATSEMYARWEEGYYTKVGGLKSHSTVRNTLQDSVCIFVAPFVFKQETPGLKERLVCGLAGWNWMKVGQGDKPIEQTAYIHEASHLHINKMEGRMVPEDEAHRIFDEVGV